MPDSVGLFAKGNGVRFRSVSDGVEKTQFNARGVFGKQGKVDAATVPGGSQGIRPPRPDSDLHGQRSPPSGLHQLNICSNRANCEGPVVRTVADVSIHRDWTQRIEARNPRPWTEQEVIRTDIQIRSCPFSTSSGRARRDVFVELCSVGGFVFDSVFLRPSYTRFASADSFGCEDFRVSLQQHEHRHDWNCDVDRSCQMPPWG